MIKYFIEYIKRLFKDKTRYWIFDCAWCSSKILAVYKPENIKQVIKVSWSNSHITVKKFICNKCKETIVDPEQYRTLISLEKQLKSPTLED